MGGKQVWAKNKINTFGLGAVRLVFASPGTYTQGDLVSTFSGLTYCDTDAEGDFSPPSGLNVPGTYDIAIFPLVGDTYRVAKVLEDYVYELEEGENIHLLTELTGTPATDDEILIADKSETPAYSEKRMTVANLLSGVTPLVGTSVIGNFPAFTDTSGALGDSGEAPGSFEPANANIQSHIGTTSGNPHAVTASEVGAPALISPSVNGNFVSFADNAGTQADSGMSKNDLSGLLDNFIKCGLIVKAKDTPDLNMHYTKGLAIVNAVNNPVAAKTTDGLAITAATAGKIKLAIVQLSDAGVVSVKDGAEVTAPAVPAFPDPDADNIMLAKLFTTASPITDATSSVTDSDIESYSPDVLGNVHGLTAADVNAPELISSTNGNLASYNGTGGELADSGIAAADVVVTSDLAAYTNNKIQEGLYAYEKTIPDLNIYYTKGISKVDGVLSPWMPDKTSDGLAITAATAGNKKTGILQIAKTTGTVSVKMSTPIALGATPCTRPTPDADNIVMANLFGLTDADAILEATSAVTNADIDNSAGARF